MENFTFINSNGRKCGGTAALLHEIKEEGGYEEFMKMRLGSAIEEFLNSPFYDEIELRAQVWRRRKGIEVSQNNECISG